MSRSLLENEERPILDMIWNLDLHLNNISEWFNLFSQYAYSDNFIRKGFAKKDKKATNNKQRLDNSLGFCRSRILVLLSYTIQFRADWKKMVDTILNINNLEDFKHTISDTILDKKYFPKTYSSAIKGINSANDYLQLIIGLDRIFHMLNEDRPIPLQFIQSSLEIAVYLYELSSKRTIITELVGILTEVYLMITTCLPTSSSLFQRSSEYGINASQKLLFEILFFQMYTFPVISWSELKSEISSILLYKEIPGCIISLFASLYFIYENTSFNVNPNSKSFCDHTTRVINKTLLFNGISAFQAAKEMKVTCDVLCGVLNRMLSVLGNPVYPHDSSISPIMENRVPPFHYLKVSESMLNTSDEKLTILLYRAYECQLTSSPIIDIDNKNYASILSELFKIETRDISILQSYYLWLFSIFEYISQKGLIDTTEPSSLAIQLCHQPQNLKELDFEKGFPAYKRLLIHQYQLAYLNNPSFEHTNNSQCRCCHCLLSHIQRSGNMNQVYCRYCSCRFAPCLQSSCNNYYSNSYPAHELSNVFDVLSPNEMNEITDQNYLDLSDSSSSKDVFYVRVNVSLNEIADLLYRDITPEKVMKSISTSESSRQTELTQFISKVDYNDRNCSSDWLQLKYYKAEALRLTLVNSILDTYKQVKENLEDLCLTIIHSLAVLLLKKCESGYSIPDNNFYPILQLFIHYINSNNSTVKNIKAKEELLKNCSFIPSFCYYLIYPQYLLLQKNESLHTLLLQRNMQLYQTMIQENHSETMELVRVFFSFTSIEDIQTLDRLNFLNIHNFTFTMNELSIILTVIKRKSVLNFYHAFCNTYKPDPLTMDYLAGRHQQYENDSLSSFLERQKVNLRAQIIRYDEKVRKYNTNRYLAEYCFSLRLCNLIKTNYLSSSSSSTSSKSKYDMSKQDNYSVISNHKNSIDPPEHHLSSYHAYPTTDLSTKSHHTVKSSMSYIDSNSSDNSSMNDDFYVLEEKNHDYTNESFSHESIHSYPLSTTSTRLTYPSIVPSYSSSPSIAIPNTLYNNNTYSVLPLTFLPTSSIKDTYTKQAQTQNTQKVQLPPTFEYREVYRNSLVCALHSKMDDSTHDSLRLNFFFSYALLWLFSSKTLLQLVHKGKTDIDIKQQASNKPVSSPIAIPTSITVSPSIQSICAALNTTPSLRSPKNELEIIDEFVDAIQKISTSPTLVCINDISISMSKKLIESNLLSKYQQFGISFFYYSFSIFLYEYCTEDAVDYFLISLHHQLNVLCQPPTSIVDYIHCSCYLHHNIALHYSYSSHCQCSTTNKQYKSTFWITLPGYSYHSMIQQKLASFKSQPSLAARQVATEKTIQQTFSHFIRQSLIPYQRICSQCNELQVQEFQFEDGIPQVLLIRFSWATSFPMNEKDLTFCGIPEKIQLSDIHPSGKGKYALRSVFVRNKENGEAIICWNDVMKRYVLYTLFWSASMEKFEYINFYCSQLRFQPLLLLYDLISDE